MNVPMLRYSSGMAELRQFLPVLHPLWGADYSALGHPTNITYRVQQTTLSHAQSVGGLGTQRSGTEGLGEGCAGDWPGAIYGVRAPDPKEIPLSWEEVHILRKVFK